jgi:hypothetical protein
VKFSVPSVTAGIKCSSEALPAVVSCASWWTTWYGNMCDQEYGNTNRLAQMWCERSITSHTNTVSKVCAAGNEKKCHSGHDVQGGNSTDWCLMVYVVSRGG